MVMKDHVLKTILKYIVNPCITPQAIFVPIIGIFCNKLSLTCVSKCPSAQKLSRQTGILSKIAYKIHKSFNIAAIKLFVFILSLHVYESDCLKFSTYLD